MSTRKRGTSTADRIRGLERQVRTKGRGYVQVPIRVLAEIFELAKRAPKTRGRQPIGRRAKMYENMVISSARGRKAELIAGGLPRGKATDQAAQEAKAKLKKRNLALSTIKRRMQRRQ